MTSRQITTSIPGSLEKEREPGIEVGEIMSNELVARWRTWDNRTFQIELGVGERVQVWLCGKKWWYIFFEKVIIQSVAQASEFSQQESSRTPVGRSTTELQ